MLIALYVWFRFTQVMFGFAAILALVHDVLVTLGALAVSSYVADYLGFLGVEPFKINLPIIAAFLTIIGYSLNDTIVIFDRIREIRGKSTELSPELVNTSINQTLSRTLADVVDGVPGGVDPVCHRRPGHPRVRLCAGRGRHQRNVQHGLHRHAGVDLAQPVRARHRRSGGGVKGIAAASPIAINATPALRGAQVPRSLQTANLAGPAYARAAKPRRARGAAKVLNAAGGKLR